MKSFKEEPVNILVPISGAGQRFRDAGFDIPKPLIKVCGRSMVEWGVLSCDFLRELTDYRLIFTVRQEHVDSYQIDLELKNIFGESSIVIPINTNDWLKGQAAHCLAAKEYINNDQRLFIYNCDTYSLSPMGELIDRENPDGILACFISSEERFSYAKLDSQGYVCETAEKKPISNFATTGHYYFRRGADFVRAVEAMIKNGEKLNDEYYVAPGYNILIGEGLKIRIVMATSNWVMGTPQEMESFIKRCPKGFLQ